MDSDKEPCDFSWELRTADMQFLIEQFEAYIKYIENSGDYVEGKQLFFSTVLLGYYDAMMDGLNISTGHVLYRLSDFLDEDERNCMMIYPSPEGSIIDSEFGPWDSLQDWRTLWESHHPVIPEFDFRRHLETQELLKLTKGDT